jgi:predicted SprT family Zn-dependent metalloprotease
MKLSVSPSLNALAPEELLQTLQEEFHRLNRVHFHGRLIPPEIVLSARKTYGGYYQPKTHRIVLSLQAYREHGWEETLNTFRHEVAHVVHQNHSRAFWDLASALGVTQRYAKPPLKLAASQNRRRYLYVCDACGQKITRLKRIRHASCGACDKKYNPRFPLRLLE